MNVKYFNVDCQRLIDNSRMHMKEGYVPPEITNRVHLKLIFSSI